MCGKANPDTNDVCQFCGARLKPFVLPQTSDLQLPASWNKPTTPAAPIPPAPEESWLSGLRAESEDDQPVPTPSDQPPAIDDWLSRLRADNSDAAPPPAQTGGLVIGAEEPPKFNTDFLKSRLGGVPVTPPPPTAPAKTAAAEPESDWLKTLEAPPSKRIELPKTAPLVMPDSMKDEIDSEVPDWLKSFDIPQAGPPGEPKNAPPLQPQDDTPSWLKQLESPAAPEVETPLIRPKTAPLVMPDTLEVEPPTDVPDWLKSFSTPGLDNLLPGFASAAADSIQSPPPSIPIQPDTPGALTAEADLPTWLAAMRPTGFDIPGVPVDQPASSLDSDEWLGASTPVIGGLTAPSSSPPPTPESPRAPKAPGLATTDLPDWLKALRPPDAHASFAEMEPEREETVGPLAGMRGTLLAESAIAVAGKPGASVARFVVSERQTKYAEILRGIVSEETEKVESKPRRKLRLTYAWDRLLIAAALAAAALAPYLLPSFVPAGLFPAPTRLSPAAADFISTLDGLPGDQPVLVAFEYEPASTGELNPGVDATLNHLLRRGLRVVAVSTFPTGAALAQDALDRAAVEANIADSYGVKYINLGYIPGGASGLGQFAASSRTTLLADFRDGKFPWNLDVTKGVRTAKDFSLVVVAAATAESAQAWIEQVQPAAKIKIAVVSSAAAEPLLYPYYAGGGKQIAGLISGWTGAAAYDNATGRATLLAQRDPLYATRWPAYALGLVVASGMLIIGALVGAAGTLLTRAADERAAKTARAAADAAANAPQSELKRPAPKAKTASRAASAKAGRRKKN